MALFCDAQQHTLTHAGQGVMGRMNGQAYKTREEEFKSNITIQRTSYYLYVLAGGLGRVLLVLLSIDLFLLMFNHVFFLPCPPFLPAKA